MADDIAALPVSELRNASFMTVQLELTDAQQEKLIDFVGRATTTARDKYMGSLKKDERTEAVVQIVEGAMRQVVERPSPASGRKSIAAPSSRPQP